MASFEDVPFHEEKLKASIKNGEAVDLKDVPLLDYEAFYERARFLLQDSNCHCINYFGFRYKSELRLMMCIADDGNQQIYMISYQVDPRDNNSLKSLTPSIQSLHIFEREIWENFGIDFYGHPWLKPVRYAHDRFEPKHTLRNYPFFQMDSDELHEVGVGPIHAGVIEPGHFRFICNGEEMLHLEIQLGYQHRGVEKLFLEKPTLLQKNILAESITGDTVVGHSLAYVQNMERLLNIEVSDAVQIHRSIALELERIAIHTGDLSGMCIDTAYQLGAGVYGVLRTPIINFFQFWCGNRFAKGLIRIGYNPYPLHTALVERFQAVLADFKKRYLEMTTTLFNLPSIQGRFENVGEVTKGQMELIGAVGMPARIVGIPRDIRKSHPFAYFSKKPIRIAICETGDVWARVYLRHLEIMHSMKYISILLKKADTFNKPEQQGIYNPEISLKTSFEKGEAKMAVSLTEGWRGEICHCTIVNEDGKLNIHKVKDPSMHNWMALALACRENEISDFPINNKSFDLSYCGADL